MNPWLDHYRQLTSAMVNGNPTPRGVPAMRGEADNEAPIVSVKVWSDLLDAAVWVVADVLPCDEWPADAPAYTHSAVKILQQAGLQTLAWVQTTKVLFGARVVGERKACEMSFPNAQCD